MGDQWVGESTPYLTPRGDAWGSEAASQGRSGAQQILFAGEVRPRADVAQRLGLRDDEVAIKRRRLMLLDGHPVEITDSYWPAPVARDTPLAVQGKIPGGSVTALKDLGYTPAGVQEEVATRPASDEERGLLHLDEAEWVLVLTRVISDQAERVYEVSEMVTPGRAKRLRYAMRVS